MAFSLPSRPMVCSARATTNRLISNNVPRRTFTATPSLLADKKKTGTELSDLHKLRDVTGASASDQPTPLPKKGGLASSSIFKTPEAKIRASDNDQEKNPLALPKASKASAEASAATDRKPEIMARALVPLPDTRARWHRNMVIKAIHRRGRLSHKEALLRTERSSTTASHLFKTSMKKLNPLARQIAGKNIDDAILQMRFSKKKAAIDVKEHLEHARNEAIVKRGLGLGQVWENTDAAKTKKTTPEPVKIKLKNGSWKTITDPTSMYIEQAWVGKGPYGRAPDYRARGQVYMLRPPYTGITVVLKEEKTRIREYQEREAKLLRQRKEKAWTQLKDRKVTAQRQWYSW